LTLRCAVGTLKRGKQEHFPTPCGEAVFENARAVSGGAA
jgi:hypothetical protein